jgi:hypothetical protein
MANATRAVRPSLRRLHIYLSFFIAPSLIFFSITGAFQTFRIPDQKTAPVLLQKLARVHRDDVFALKAPAPSRPTTRPAGTVERAPTPRPAPPVATTMVKWFFVVASALIVLTTSLGLWMGLAYSRDRKALWLLLLAGAALPAVLLAL